MRKNSPHRVYSVILSVFVAFGCGGDGGTGNETPRAARLEVVTAASATGIVGAIVPTTPEFVVKDQFNRPMAGVPVTVATSGNGALISPPTVTVEGATSVGPWRLGTVPGPNSVVVTVEGIAPLTITVNAQAGPIATLATTAPVTLDTIVGRELNIAVTAADEYGNAASGALIQATTSGGSVPQTVTTDANGVALVPWTVSTTPGTATLTLVSGSGSLVVTANTRADVPKTVNVVSGNSPSAYAGRVIANPIVLAVRDQFGNGVAGINVAFTVIAGGGSIASSTAVSGANGAVTAPAWKLGTSVVPQQLRATVAGGTSPITATVSATVSTAYNISVRFFGPSMSSSDMALFNSAAARIGAMVTGDVEDVSVFGADLAQFCETPGLPTLNEVVDDVIIYASIASIDGPGSVLAQAGPCAVRSSGSQLPIIGIMEFDAADLATLSGAGSLQDVIIHEMMHVLGIGTYWNAVGLLTGYNTSSVAYVGASGTAGCRAVGGTSTCASSVPVENTGGAGTANGHWRESVFGAELMTGYANAGAMPISRMTIGAFLDLGYQVNYDAAAAYQIPGTGAALFSLQRPTLSTPQPAWERLLKPKVFIDRSGQVTEHR